MPNCAHALGLLTRTFRTKFFWDKYSDFQIKYNFVENTGIGLAAVWNKNTYNALLWFFFKVRTKRRRRDTFQVEAAKEESEEEDESEEENESEEEEEEEEEVPLVPLEEAQGSQSTNQSQVLKQFYYKVN